MYGVRYSFDKESNTIRYGACIWRQDEHERWSRKLRRNVHKTAMDRYNKNPVCVVLNHREKNELNQRFQFRRLEQFIVSRLLTKYGVCVNRPNNVEEVRLEFYENTTQSLYAGAEFSVMPGGNLTLYGFWTPVYNIKYSIKDGGLRTIEGEGWEAGIRIVLPSQAVNTIRLSKKIEINLQRIPFEFHINSITDRYSGAVINIRRFSIGYLL